MSRNQEIQFDGFELEHLTKAMDKNLETRQQYLTFSFATTVTLLGVFVSFEKLSSLFWFPLLVYVIIIPFQARITYSRIIHANMEAYIKVYYKEQLPYYHNRILDFEMLEQDDFIGRYVISRLANFELTILSLALTICMVRLTPISLGTIIIYILLDLIVFRLALYSYNYGEIEKKYEIKYDEKKNWNGN